MSGHTYTHTHRTTTVTLAAHACRGLIIPYTVKLYSLYVVYILYISSQYCVPSHNKIITIIIHVCMCSHRISVCLP